MKRVIPIFEHYEETVTETRAPVYLYPVNLDIDVASESTTRARGLFEVPVYTAVVDMGFDFDAEAAEGALRRQGRFCIGTRRGCRFF